MTFLTLWVRKRWLKLPFGGLAASDVPAQAKWIVVWSNGVEPIADNTLIVRCSDTGARSVTGAAGIDGPGLERESWVWAGKSCSF